MSERKVEFNANHEIEIRLTERGRNILADAEYTGGLVEIDGIIRDQFWQIIHIFGPHYCMGPEPPFETVFHFIIKDK